MKTLKLFCILVYIISMLISPMSFAAEENLLDENGVILQGYDTVAYFTKNEPVKGNAGISALYDGAIYHFTSEKNRDLFKSNPAQYAPQYGGYCAYGAAIKKKFPINPSVFAVVDGKLYVNATEDVAKLWGGKQASFIGDADKAWPKIREIAADKL